MRKFTGLVAGAGNLNETLKEFAKRSIITIGLDKPHLVYKGKKVSMPSQFIKHNINEYRLILLKKSKLSANKRVFVKLNVESWLERNDINIKEFQDELRNRN
ncbi:hypothetical protein Phi18:2_gp40 [Cellulophaga phage phi18:2]|uniref:Uncharacterized protein n=2 Tax=Cellulophaga phage phi18:1 TaxID=1327982 RepID=S0A4M3_9CAUD|nr:hypothetical protein Phi18:1_gp42 [Cellulophaga phage phi18:1]AGO48489.1 hypothetical protein Phi18:1_gp42 [Cellulophaga phage phi18:1]AGO49203.1 hypothetical protein Phi18:2_gp40 [Cellulophaga phage phi18:2]